MTKRIPKMQLDPEACDETLVVIRFEIESLEDKFNNPIYGPNTVKMFEDRRDALLRAETAIQAHYNDQMPTGSQIWKETSA